MSVIAMAQTHVAGKYHAKNQKIMFRNKVNLPLKQANTMIYLFMYYVFIHKTFILDLSFITVI